MGSGVSWLLDLDVTAGREAEFKALMTEMVAATQAKEPGTINYEWSTTADGTRCQIYERYVDSAAVLVHLASFGQHYAARFMTVVTPTRLVVHGSPSEEAKAALAALGPVYMQRAAGFSR